jgi:hypothetical protein
MQQPQQLNIKCTLGALKLSKQGSLDSIVARHRLPENNQASSFSANYESKVNSNYSKNFKTLTRGAGGVMPRLNLTIGAPMATFIEYSILPDQTHPVYNLIKAASKSVFSSFQYNIPAYLNSVTFNQGQGITNAPGLESITDYFNLGNSGYIPLKQGEIKVATRVNTTYNIWKQSTNDDLSKKIIPGLGITNYESLGVPHVETAVGPPIPSITVNAANSISLMERIFPIADDLAYFEEPEIYFSKPGSNSLITKKVKAKGGYNCGFWIRFNNLTDFSFYKSANNTSKSSIRLAFGNFVGSNSYESKITQFFIIINENSTILRYTNPVTKQYDSINLNNKATINSGTLDVFIHFAGPNLYVGFDKEVSNWNVFEPPSIGSDDSKVYEPFIDHQAIVRVLIENFNCSFTYSPICFDAYDADSILSAPVTGSTYTNSEGNSSINLRFNIHSKDDLALLSCNEDSLNRNLIARANPFLQSDSNPLTERKEGPTYYSDWRRINSGETTADRIRKTATQYAENQELKYFEISKSENTAKSNDPRTFFKGKIRYETTIEGPVFFYARNFKEDEIETENNKMVQSIWGKYSDISKYFKEAKITESFKNKNLSYKESTAVITLINMTNDNIGRQILNAMQENILVITLKCGYGEDEHVYFQGVIKTVAVNRSSDSFTATVTCQDLGDYLLDNIRFPFLSYFGLGLRTYKGLLEDTFELAGLTEYYKPRPKPNPLAFDVLHDYYFNRYQGDPIYQLSLNNRLFQVNVGNKIKQVMTEILQHLIYTSDRSGYFNLYLPVFRWDAENEVYVFGLRGDEEAEELWLAGEPSDEQKLANDPDRLSDDPNANLIHGIVQGGSSGWSETTEVDNLHSEIWLIGRRYDNEPMFFQSNPSFINRALSEESFQKLNELVQEGINLEQEHLGYVGFNKIFYSNEDVTNSLVRTNQLARKQFEVYENASRITYQELKLSIYVTKPLKTHSRFTVKSFKDSGFVDFSGEYNYSAVEYTITAEDNIITANVSGNYFPRIL